MDRIINILKRKNLFGYNVNEMVIERTELYYVLDKLEVNRSVSQTLYSVCVYTLHNDLIGSASFSLYSNMTDRELEEKIDENIISSSFALNKYYELPSNSNVEKIERITNLNGNPYDVLENVKNAIFSAKSEAHSSATEFFLEHITSRVVNSNGIDLTDEYYKLNIELVPTYKNVETYKMLELDSFDSESLTKETKELLDLAVDRYNAINLSDLSNPNIILENDEVAQLLSYFSDDLTYGAKYQNINLNEINDSVQGDIIGDKLNIKMSPYYPGCINSRLFDSDGVALKEIDLIKDGIALNRYGSYRFGYYLKEKPTGILPIMVVGSGSKSIEDFKSNKYIRCVRFSNMQLDSNTGFFGGEVRLGFYFDGEREIPVTGFSISGNINELKKGLYLSKELVNLPNYHGPKYIYIKGMKIA